MLALELLGPVTLYRDGTALPLNIKKTQALLVLLARGGGLPRGRVVALLWPELDEPTGRRNLRRELARLREAGAADAVQVQGDFLALAPGLACDARAFEAALAEDRPEAALALWHGPPADGLALGDADAFDDWLAAERTRLADTRRRALEAAATALEARGDLAAALSHVETLLAEDPLQEQRHRDAMRLHAAAGRRETALAQFERCRAVLQAELGLTPMAETEALAARLRGSPAAAPAPAVAPVAQELMLPESLPFVGRVDEVAALESAWQAGRAVLIEGEAGVGKTRLALDFVAAHGPCALARCRPGDEGVPYAAFTRALRALAGPAPVLDGLPGWAVDELARLLPEIGAAPSPIRSDEERSRFFEACVQGWLAWAADSFDAVVLDDWHHADAASHTLLCLVSQRRRDAMPGTAREVLLLRPVIEADSLRRLREGLHAVHLRLPPLGDAAVIDLVQRLSGAAHPVRFAARLHGATGGNPFFLAETLRHLAELQLLSLAPDGSWRTPFDAATQDYRELPVPGSVLEAVLARVRRLPAACLRVLDAAALAAEPFAPALLAPACALSEVDTVFAIEQAVQAQLLREHEAGGFAFAHDLVRQALDGALGAERRRLMHRRLALGAEAAGAAPAVIAAHHEASGDNGRAVAHRLAAGEQAQRLHAQLQAIDHWRKGLANGPQALEAITLHVRLMRGLRMVDQREASGTHAAAALVLATREDLPASARTDALLAVAGEFAREGRAAEALEIIDSLPGPLAGQQQLDAMNAHASALRELGRVQEALAIGREALAMPALRGRARADLLDSLVISEHRAGHAKAALELSAQSLALSREVGDDLGVARGLNRRGIFLLESGDMAGAEAELHAAVAQCERLGLVSLQRGSLYNLCCMYSAQGLPVQGLAAAQRIWALQPPMQRSELRVMVHLAFVDAQIALGDLGDAWVHAAAAVDDALAVGLQLGAAAVLMTAIELFGLLGARATADRLLASLTEEAMRQMPQVANEMWLARAHFELLAGDVAAAAQALARIDAPARLEHQRVRLRHGVVAAELALALGDTAGGLAWLPADSAAGMNDEMRLQGLAVRLGAETRAGAFQPATLQAVQRALASPHVHTAAALALVRALSAAQQAHPGAVPGELLVLGAALVARLAASLQAHPGQQAAFLSVNG